MVMYKETIQLVFFFRSSQSHAQQSKAKRKGTVFKLFKSMHGYICDHGEDYC